MAIRINENFKTPDDNTISAGTLFYNGVYATAVSQGMKDVEITAKDDGAKSVTFVGDLAEQFKDGMKITLNGNPFTVVSASQAAGSTTVIVTAAITAINVGENVGYLHIDQVLEVSVVGFKTYSYGNSVYWSGANSLKLPSTVPSRYVVPVTEAELAGTSLQTLANDFIKDTLVTNGFAAGNIEFI